MKTLFTDSLLELKNLKSMVMAAMLLAIAVVLEHGAKGAFAMDVAKDLLNAYFFPNEVAETTNGAE